MCGSLRDGGPRARLRPSDHVIPGARPGRVTRPKRGQWPRRVAEASRQGGSVPEWCVEASSRRRVRCPTRGFFRSEPCRARLGFRCRRCAPGSGATILLVPRGNPRSQTLPRQPGRTPSQGPAADGLRPPPGRDPRSAIAGAGFAAVLSGAGRVRFEPSAALTPASGPRRSGDPRDAGMRS